MESKSNKKINRELPNGATPLSPEDLEGLLPRYITTRQELNDAEFKNISEASKKYLLSRKKLLITIGFLFKIHKEMFGQVWGWAGEKRRTNKNIGVDKAQIEIELKKLIDDFKYWKDRNLDPLEISARLHHRLVFIHPFNNGNGRWARFIVNLFLIEHMGSYLDFPEDDLVLSTKIREAYIQALRAVDDLDFEPLTKFHQHHLSNFAG